jgi:hypothetical protein
MADDVTNKRSWFARHKFLTIVLTLIIIGILGSALGGGNDKNSSSTSKTNNSSATQQQYRFKDRADKQKKDVEVLPGETATIGGVKMTLTNVQYSTSLSEFETADEGKTYVSADVAMENSTNKTQPYNVFDFRIQTAGGQVLDNAIVSEPNLSSGDLVSGGKAQGKVYFQVPVEDGHQYVIWKPGLSSDRAIVQVK